MWPADTGRAMAVSTTINTTSNVESGVIASTVEVLAAVTVGGLAAAATAVQVQVSTLVNVCGSCGSFVVLRKCNVES